MPMGTNLQFLKDCQGSSLHMKQIISVYKYIIIE